MGISIGWGRERGLEKESGIPTFAKIGCKLAGGKWRVSVIEKTWRAVVRNCQQPTDAIYWHYV